MIVERDEPLFPQVFDLLRAYGHRPGLHLVRDPENREGYRRAWLSAAGFGALGQSIEHASRLYVEAGASLARDPQLRSALRRLGSSGHALH